MAQAWFEIRWLIAALLLHAILTLVKREAPRATIIALQDVGDELRLSYEGLADGSR